MNTKILSFIVPSSDGTHQIKEGAELVYLTGDIHGDPTPIHELIKKCQPTEGDIIVLLGDVGLNYTGHRYDRLLKHDLNCMNLTFFCIHGNHENRPQTSTAINRSSGAADECCTKKIFPTYCFR